MKKPDYEPCRQKPQCTGGSTSDCAWKESMRMPTKHYGTSYSGRGQAKPNHLGGYVIDNFKWD